MDFEVQRSLEEFKNKRAIMNHEEVFIINISPQLFTIKSFGTYSTKFPITGISFIFHYYQGQGRVVMKISQEDSILNLQEVFEWDMQPDEFCYYDYRNKLTQARIYLNKEQEISLDLGSQSCIKKKFPSYFQMDKQTVSFFGFSSGISPINIILKKIELYKYTLGSQGKDFHEDESILGRFSYNDSTFKKDVNLANVLVVSSKIDKQLSNQINVLDLLQKRTNNIEGILEEESKKKKTSNQIHDDSELVEKINMQVSKLDSLINYNKEIFDGFQEIVQNFEHVDNFFTVSDKFQTIIDFVEELDEMIKIQKFSTYLDNLSKLMDDKEELSFWEVSKKIKAIQSNIKNQRLGHIYKIMCFIVIVVMLIFIVKIVHKIQSNYDNILQLIIVLKFYLRK